MSKEFMSKKNTELKPVVETHTLWDELKSKQINLYGFAKLLEECVDKKLSETSDTVIVTLKAGAALPAIEAALNCSTDPVGNIVQTPKFNLELLDGGYVTISKIKTL
jgi:hypothetical protein